MAEARGRYCSPAIDATYSRTAILSAKVVIISRRSLNILYLTLLRKVVG